MNVKQHTLMTASEIAMGRYMRAPDHDATSRAAAITAAEDEFSNAFDQQVLEDSSAAAPKGDGSGSDDGGSVASGDGGDGAAAPAGDGAGAVAAAEGQGDGAAPAGDQAPAKDGGEAAPAPGPEAGGEGGKGAGAGEGGDADGGAGADAGAVAAEPAAAAKPAAVPADNADVDQILDRLASAVAAKAPPAAVIEAQADAPPLLYSEAEQGKIDKFKEDWPDIAEAFDLRNREFGSGVIKYVFDQIAPEVRQIKELVQTLSLRAAHGDIVDAIGAYPSDEEIDNVKSWVETQPSYLQAPMNGVIEKGTADEIIDLVSRYREATGKQPAPTPAADQVASEGDTELSGSAKQAAAALAPVGSKRSVVQNPDDSSDFDAGWAKWADMTV